MVHTNSPDSKVKSPKYKWCTMLHSTSFVLWLNFKQNSIILCRLKTCSNSFKFYLVKLIIHKLNLNMYVAVWGNRHPLMMLFTILLYKYKKSYYSLKTNFITLERHDETLALSSCEVNNTAYLTCLKSVSEDVPHFLWDNQIVVIIYTHFYWLHSSFWIWICMWRAWENR